MKDMMLDYSDFLQLLMVPLKEAINLLQMLNFGRLDALGCLLLALRYLELSITKLEQKGLAESKSSQA